VTAESDEARDLSLKHFLKEAFVAVTDVDSALIASFRALVTRPGTLTAEYLRGDREKFLAPFRLFLLCNIIYFVAVAQFGIGALTAPLRVQTDQMLYKGVTRMIVANRLDQNRPATTLDAAATRDSTLRMFAVKYDGATEGVGKAIVVVLIPLYAIVLQVLYAGRKRFYAEHLVFATHLIAFLMLAIAVLGTLAGLIGGMAHQLILTRSGNDELFYSALLLAAFSVYAYMAQRTVYATSASGALARTLALTLSVVPMLVAFKFVLFLVTLYWIA
jgi:hypothetical protein